MNEKIPSYNFIEECRYENLLIKNLGIKEYNVTWNEMHEFTKNRTYESNDEIWYLEHNSVFTLGQAGKKEHILTISDIPLVQTDRGGQVTYHGPGQLVGYLLVNLKRKNLGIKQFVCGIEQAVIKCLAEFDIKAHRIESAPGIYVNNAKICSLGLRVKNGCTYHGLSFNVNMDLTPFLYINPCGYKGMKVTQLKDLGGPDNIIDLMPILTKHLTEQLGYRVTVHV